MKVHFYTDTHAVTLMLNEFDIPSMAGFGSETVYAIVEIGLPLTVNDIPYAENTTTHKIRNTYKSLKTRAERIAVWSFLKRYEYMMQDSYQAERSKVM